MSKGGKTSTQTVTPDSQTQDMRGDLWRRGQATLNDPRYGSLMGAFQGAGQTGADALGSGDFSAYMNPYIQQVIQRIQGGYGDASAMAMNAVDDRATRQGAFGGSRAAISRGQAAGDVATRQGDQIAQLLYGGWNDAGNRATQSANLGLTGYQSLAGMPGSLFDPVAQYGGNTQTQTMPGGSMLGGLVGAGLSFAGGPFGGLLAAGAGGGGLGGNNIGAGYK